MWDAISNFEIVATGRYLLIAFQSLFHFWIFKMCSNFQKVEGVFVNRSVPCLWSPLAPNLRSCPCVAAALSGSLAFCARSWRGIQIQTAHAIFKVRVWRIAGRWSGCKFSRDIRNRPARDQRILSGISGGKMVRRSCGAAVYHSKVIGMGKRISWERRSVNAKDRILDNITQFEIDFCLRTTKEM